MKHSTRFAPLALSLLAAGLFTFTSCGEKSVDGTYSVTMDGNSYIAVEAVETDFVNDTGKYAKLDRLLNYLCGYNAEAARKGETVENVNDLYTVSLDLKGSDYLLTKAFKINYTEQSAAALGIEEGKTPSLTLTFTGTFTSAEGKVALDTPTKVGGSIYMGSAGAAYTRFLGNYEEIDVAAADIDDLLFPGHFLYYFNTMYFIDGGVPAAMNVTLDQEAKTFTC